MKKYYPVFGVILTFSLYLLSQTIWNSEVGRANIASMEKKKKAHLEEVYKKTKLALYKEKKPIELHKVKSPLILLNFWASWCVPCLEEFPSLIELRKIFPETDLQIFGVNTDDGKYEKKIEKVKRRIKFNFPIVLDLKGELVNGFKIETIPSTLIFHKGKVIQWTEGKVDFGAEEFKEKLKSLLK